MDVSASMGLALYPDHGMDQETFTGNADAARYESKAAGRSRVVIFEERGRCMKGIHALHRAINGFCRTSRGPVLSGCGSPGSPRAGAVGIHCGPVGEFVIR